MEKIDLNALILENEKIKTAKAAEPAEQTKRKTSVTYSVTCTGRDFVVAKRTAKTEELFVILISHNQCYIRRNDGQAESVTVDNMTKFFSGLTDPLEVNAEWIGQIIKGKQNTEHFCRMLEAHVADAVEHCCFYMTWNIMADRRQLNLYKEDPLLYRYMIDAGAAHKKCSRTDFIKTEIKGFVQPRLLTHGTSMKYTTMFDTFSTFHVVSWRFGTEKGQLLVDSYLMSQAHSMMHDSTLRMILDRCRFDPDRMIEYITFDLCRQGYSHDISQAATGWEYALSLQRQIYSEVTDQYPEHLAETCRNLRTMSDMLDQMTDEETFSEAVKKMLPLEWSPEDDHLMIVCPQTRAGMYDAAMQLQNTLAFGINDVAAGKHMVCFLKSRKDPEKSIAAIEVSADGKIGQVQGRNGRRPDEQYIRFIRRWAEEKGLSCAAAQR